MNTMSNIKRMSETEACRTTNSKQLLYFPYSTPSAQRGTAVLLLMSNVLVLLIHKLLFTGQNKSEDPDEMLFINFIGIEPKNLIKVVLVDFITITLQVVILQCKGDPTSIRFLSALPVPASIDLVHIDEDPNISRPVEHTTDQHQQREDDSTQESPET